MRLKNLISPIDSWFRTCLRQLRLHFNRAKFQNQSI